MSLPPAPSPTAARRALAITILVVAAGYVLVARAVSSFYPFSVFPMYSGLRAGTASRLLARRGDGRLEEVTHFRALACDRRVDPGEHRRRCGDLGRSYSIGYIDDELYDHVRREQVSTAPGAAAQNIDLVWHVWRFDAPGRPSEEDCVLARCAAVRR